MDHGFIKIHRSIRQWKYYDKPIYLKIWIEILLSATHVEKIYKGEKLKPGEFTTSRSALAARCKVPASSLRSAIKVLTLNQQITTCTNSQRTKITVLNWENYQHSAGNFSERTPVEHQKAQKVPLSRIKKKNKEKEYIYIKKHFPVSDEVNNFFGDIPESTLLRWKEIYPKQAFCEAAQEIMEYIQSKPKKYKNYRSALNNLLQRNFATKPYYEKYNKSQQDQEHMQNLRNFFDKHAR